MNNSLSKMLDNVFHDPRLLWAAVIAVLVLLRLVYCLCVPDRNDIKKGKVKTMVILGSGGHTGEMLVLLKNLDRSRYAPITYVLASSDTTSQSRVERLENRMNKNGVHAKFKKIYRSREVGQSYFTSIFTTLRAMAGAFFLMLTTWPDVILCNGPGTCVPLCLIAFFFKRVLCFSSTPIIYVESFCRVESLSLSGRVLYYIASRFIVMWPQLVDKYPRAEFIGRIM